MNAIMRNQTARTRAQFKQLLTMTAQAAAELERREIEARVAGDESVGDQFAIARERVFRRMHIISLAETEFLLSPLSTEEVVERLNDATDQLRSTLKELRQIATALAAAAQLIALLEQLVTLFQ